MTYKFKAVIFDLDGTLLNTLDDLADSANAVLAELGCPVHDTEKYRYFVGNGIPRLIERILPEDKQHLKEQALAMFMSRYELHSKDKTVPYPEMKETLAKLKNAGLSLGVITNKANNVANEVVKYYFGAGIFDCVKGLDESIKAKPDPAGALQVAAALGVKPQEVLYVGDSGVDMKTAVNAGFTPCGVLWGFRKKDELIENGAKLIISTPAELLNIIGHTGEQNEKTVS